MKKKKKPSTAVPGKPAVKKVKAKKVKSTAEKTNGSKKMSASQTDKPKQIRSKETVKKQVYSYGKTVESSYHKSNYGKSNLRLLSATQPSKAAYSRGGGKKKVVAVTVGTILLFLVIISAFVVKKYTITSVTVEGNVHYTSDEIIKFVMNGKYDNNSLYLAFKYKNKGIEDIPFIETMDVAILSPNAIKITVYEKAIAGYVEYLGRFMYFDKDGIVVETSDMRTEGIPEVTGLSFDHIVLYEALPVENAEVFTKILNITQLLTKYDIMTDKIFFNKQNEMTLYFGSARVKLGDGSNLDEKIMRLTDILPDLEGKKGVLQMENYSEDTPNITFELDS